MLPMLHGLADGEVHQLRDFYDRLADQFNLTDEERSEVLPSGQQRVVVNRIAWARTYLKKAGLLESVKRGHIRITDAGSRLLATNPESIDQKLLEQYESFREFAHAKPNDSISQEDGELGTPEEIIEAAYKKHRHEIQGELLDTLKNTDPFFFEKVVITLLREMGYGGATGRGLTTPRSSDGGIDGIIYEDKLGLDKVVVQAKRWEGTVGRQVIQAFVGSMDYHRSRKGVVLTTGCYSKEAIEYIDRIEGKTVVLVDGNQLTALMIDHGVGVTRSKRYELSDISQDFFNEDDG
ncbi:restriction endonuclease [Aeoliella mucimassa]|uniref:Mrr restriction system protein n=1 Tax=Aeoliella mucimassa TaxID=2527972 RepID=A0A518AJN3_9BACT|nr:restriction endonuclease [Aeoliella mucimassa]QDU54948.1 Mrr restriction system protein [Aeoliella mucimassa]